MNGLLPVGLAMCICAVLGIVYITIPNVTNIGHEATNVANSQTNQQIVKSGISIAISGFLLWLTTGLLIGLFIGGIVITLIGFT